MVVMRFLVFCGALLLVVATPLGAQRLADARVGVRHTARAELSTTAKPVAIDSEPGTLHWPYALGGALVGGIAAGAVVAHAIQQSDDPMIIPILPIGLFVTGGALTGAAIGWLVSELVH